MSVQEILERVRALTLEDRKRLISLIVDTPPEDSQKPRSLMELAGLGAVRLSTDDLRQIAANDNHYETYTDILVLIQDYVTPLSRNYGAARFEREDVIQRIETGIAGEKLTVQARENLQQNYAVAQKLLGLSKTDADPALVSAAADHFLDRLLDIYRTSLKISRGVL